MPSYSASSVRRHSDRTWDQALRPEAVSPGVTHFLQPASTSWGFCSLSNQRTSLYKTFHIQIASPRMTFKLDKAIFHLKGEAQNFLRSLSSSSHTSQAIAG